MRSAPRVAKSAVIYVFLRIFSAVFRISNGDESGYAPFRPTISRCVARHPLEDGEPARRSAPFIQFFRFTIAADSDPASLIIIIIIIIIIIFIFILIFFLTRQGLRMPTSHTTQFAIADEMTIYQANEQKQQLLDALAATDDLELNLGGVPEIDTAGLQLLLLVKREASEQGKRLSIVGHSSTVQQTLDFCNLASVFGDPVLIPAHD